MRALITAIALLGCSSAIAAPSKPKQIADQSAMKVGYGAIAISVRSEIFLPDKLDVFFLRDGGKIDNDQDVIRFSRSQSVMAIQNGTTEFATKSYLVKPGRYRLVGYGVNCPSVPAPGMVCAVTVSLGSGGAPITRPSRGYEGETPTFVVADGKLTIAGDFVLLHENQMAWTPLPQPQMDILTTRFPNIAKGGDVTVPSSFRLTREVRPHQMFENFGRKF